MSELRQGTNRVTIVGILKEKNLKLINKDGKNGVAGDLVITTGENQEHKIKIFAYDKKEDGTENGLYKGFKTIYDNYLSLADVEDPSFATKVSIRNGSFKANDFSIGGKLISTVEIGANFIQTAKEDEEEKAIFEAEIFYTAIKEEVDKEGEETGRVEVKGYIVGYGGKLVPITFVSANKDIADYITSNFEKNRTGTLAGNIVSTIERKIVKKEGFGKAREEEFIKTVKEFVITGGDDQLDEDDEKSYKIEDMKKAVKERELMIEELKNKENKKESKTVKSKNADIDDSFPF